MDFEIRNTIDQNLLSESQHAYWRGKSTETVLHVVVGCLEENINRKEYSLATFLVIESAFNNVKADSITGTMSRIGIHKSLVLWVNNKLTSRIIISEMRTIKRAFKKGTPQGGVISTLL